MSEILYAVIIYFHVALFFSSFIYTSRNQNIKMYIIRKNTVFIWKNWYGNTGEVIVLFEENSILQIIYLV